ncbi:meiotic recombination protein REC8 homolog isoform X1 [Gopherus flavomarginatus]|uniref:meiotic recombination protein REC8 homolog isoform X1 n=1 Tax=Gopherus flavomarginatus TaxID=286002 RepID=UPI0021CC0394|nr:meiotic recombination protein REC8 homolog isoform X1 [Gopherus flavomarginatus]XP_050773181.1 meiotic recombination protein REC8 homolog isoform X1 [Gopherus flavomarginatus]
MGDLEQPGLLLPDNLLLMEALEDAPDPFFGVMEPRLPSPTDIPQVPPYSDYPAPLTSHRFDIFWRLPPRQRDQHHPPGAGGQGERELPEITAREIDLLAEQEDFVLPPAPPRRRPMEGGGATGILGEGGQGAHPTTPAPSHASFSPPELEEEMRAREAEITARLSPPTRVGEEPPAEVETPILPEELARLLKEELPPPPELSPPREPGLPPPPASPAVTPRVERPPVSPKLELAVYEPAPPRAPLRPPRFLDEVTQIPRDQFNKQILDVRAQCRPLVMVEVPARQRRTPAELLRAPTYGWLPPELHALWQRCAILQPVDYAALRAEEERKEEPVSEVEVAREALEPSIPVMVSSEISLETTEEEVPRPSLVTPEERRLVPEPEEALPIVPELPEVSLELPPDRDLITLEYIRRLVAAELEQVEETDFRSLVPTTTSRIIASRIFYLCLVLCGLQFLQLVQAEPYGPILLKRGGRFRPG